MMKTLKFRENLSKLIKQGLKTTTWRMFDDKDIKEGDIIQFLVWETKKPFAEAKVVNVIEKKIKDLSDNDWDGHEKFDSDEEMYKTYSIYYNTQVNKDTIVKIIKFSILKFLN